MQKKHKNKDMILLALSDEPSMKVSPFVKKNDINYIVGTAANSTFKAFGVKAYPTIFVIGTDGKVLYAGHGFDEATKSLDKALKDKPEASEEGSLEDAAAKAAYDNGLRLYQKKDYIKAMKAFEDVVKNFKGSEPAKKAAAKIKSMKTDKKIMAKIRDAEEKKQCETWLDTARLMVQNGKRTEAREYYQKVISEYPESSFAEIARKEMAAL
jgi:tetratricopeptide (TPR) repeat protein